MTKVLFQQAIQVRLADDNLQTPLHQHYSSADKSYASITLKIDERYVKSEKEFTFSLSREDDARFVYSLTLRRANFDSIRQEQDLVCDFDTFPKMIADFVNDLQRCSSSAYVKGTIADDKSTFRFELVTKMNFKWVSVVSLCLYALSDSALVTHLVERILLLKKQLRDSDNVRENLVAAQKEISESKESAQRIAREQSERIATLEAEKTEMLANEKAEEERHAEEMEELKADKEMLSTEVCVLKQEVIDFRSRVDALVEENATLKQHEQTLNESLDTMEDRLEVCEQKVRELEDLLEERDELLDERIREIDQLKSELSEMNSDNSSLRSRLRELRDDRDRWKADNEKGIKIINKLYKEQKERRLRDEYMAANGGDASGADRIKQLETDLEDRKHTIDTLNETNAQLREQMEKLMTECSNAKKDVQQWCEKYEKKEKMLGDLLKMRHSTSPTAIGTPLTTPLTQNFAQLSQTATPITYPRVLGWSTMTGQLTTPLRNSPYSRASPLGMINRENIPPTTTVTSPTLSQIAPTQPNLS